MALAIQNAPLYHGLRVTREEYLDLKDDGFKYDMIDGVLYMSPSAFSEHNLALLEIATRFKSFSGLALKTIIETDVFLPDGGDVLRPDISIVFKENYGIIKGHIHGVPDIVVEILSESTQERDLGVKADRYLANGVKEYWIADPDKKILLLWINDNKKSWRKIEGNSIASSVLPGLVINQKEIFPDE